VSAIDGGVPSVEPRIDMSGRGQGEAVAQAGDGSVMGALLDHDVFETSYPLGSSSLPSKPEVAASDRGDLAVAYRSGAEARGRVKPYRQAFAPDVPLSNPGLGAVVNPGVYVGGDRVGDFAVAMVQEAAGARTLSVASFDDPPGAPYIGADQAFKRQSRPELKWRPGLDVWGEQTFRVYVDGVPVGETKTSSLVPATPLKTGRHTWQVETVDLHGQTARSRARTLRVDATAPALKVSVSGKRSRGQALKIRVTVRDAGGSGLDHTTIDFGDKTGSTRLRSVSHRYRAGKFTLLVVGVDKAGNIARKEVKLRIKNK
jgi:hypothetical protein